MTYAVIRKAVLQEDEGFEHFIQSFTQKRDAEEWIANQHPEYFSSGDYYVQHPYPPPETTGKTKAMHKDIEKLAKLLAYTTSSNDHECLVAIRKANGMLAEKNITWALFLEGKYPLDPSHKPETVNVSDGDMDIDMMFEAVLNSVNSGTFADLIRSIHDQWERTGSITDKQFKQPLL